MRRLAPLLLLLAACGATPSVEGPGQPTREVAAWDAGTGAVLWRKGQDPPSAATDPVLLDGVAVTVGDGPLVAYDARTGERLWSLAGVGPFPPQVAGGLLVLARDGEVQAVQPRTGRQAWRADSAGGARVHAGSGGVVVLGEGLARLLDARGRQRWEAAVADDAVVALPGPDVVAVGGARGGVTALSTGDGTVRWQARTAPVATLHLATGRLLVGTDDGVVALRTGDGGADWTRRTDGARVPLQVGDGVVLAPAVDGDSVVLDLADGRVLQRVRARGGDVALVPGGVLTATGRSLRTRGTTAWQQSVPGGDRPRLRVDASGGVVVGVLDWGQPETRD